jgi:hypothetical protein
MEVNEIQKGDIFRVLRDVNIGEDTAFYAGEYLSVEAIAPNPQRPEYRYVFDSKSLGRKYQLSDAEVAFVERELRPVAHQSAEVQPQQAPSQQARPAPVRGPGEWGKVRPAESYVKRAPSKSGFALLWAERRPYVIVGVIILLAIIGFAGFKLMNRPTGPAVTMDKYFRLGESAKFSEMQQLWDPATLKEKGDRIKSDIETQFAKGDNPGKYYGILPASSMRYQTIINGNKASLHITSEYLVGNAINALLVNENGAWYITQFGFGGPAIQL